LVKPFAIALKLAVAGWVGQFGLMMLPRWKLELDDLQA
jgi:hypothetical protein